MTLGRVAEAVPQAIRLVGWPKLVIFHTSSSERAGCQVLVEEEEIFYMFRPDNTSDHMQQGLMTLHHVISLQHNVCLWTPQAQRPKHHRTHQSQYHNVHKIHDFKMTAQQPNWRHHRQRRASYYQNQQ